jgi:enoyl-CoA hydratase/carnithine racemase
VPLAGEIGGSVDREAGQRLRLVLEHDGGRPRLTAAVIERLLAALEAEPDALLVTLEGGSASFCEGLDLEAATRCASAETDVLQSLGRFAGLLAALERRPGPVVALARGPALGGGLGLLAAADLVLATPDATFGLPETMVGLIPAVVFPAVVRRIGVPRARLLALGGHPLSASQALQYGLVDEVTEDLEGTLHRYARRFARMDRRAMGEVKRLVTEHFSAPSGYLDDALSCFGRLLSSRETHARLLRFAAGEAPWDEESGS